MAAELVARFGELEGVVELALPVAVVREGEALGHFALGVELEQLVRHVAHFGLDARLGTAPGGAAHAVERRGGFARAAKALHQIHAGQRHVELGAAGIFEQHVVALRLAVIDFAQAQEAGHAMLGMHHVVAGLQVDQVRGEGGQRGLAGRRARHQFGSVEQILAAEDGEPGIAENHAAADRSADQINGRRPIRPCRRAPARYSGVRIGLIQTELVGHAVLVENIGHAFERARGFGEKCHARAGFGQSFALPRWPPACCRERPATAGRGCR